QLQRPGFKTGSITGLSVGSGENAIDAQLQAGASAETVEVTAQAPEPQREAVRDDSTPTAEVSSLRVMARDERQLTTLDQAALRKAALLPLVVSAPGGNKQWRFGDLGVIFHSADRGASWHSQISGVTTRLTAAVAPSDKVCWIAGASGTLLRTTDGGKHWLR